MPIFKHCVLLASACGLLSACTPLATPPATTAIPSLTTLSAAARSGTNRQPGLPADVLQIDAHESLLTITVRRGGALARFGHDHVIASRTLQGTVAPVQGHASFQFRLDEMSVDEQALRQKAGLDSTPSAEAIAGTRHNMLVRVLDAERYPLVQIDARRSGNSSVLDATITLHGVTRTVQVPTQIITTADGQRLHASGTLVLKQSDFGIVPFAILGGAMAVQDPMELAFNIVATKASAPGSASVPAQ